MYHPDFEEFKKLAQNFQVVPVYRELLADLDTPVSALKKVSLDEESAFLLESVEGGERFSRYSFLGTRPSMIVSGSDGRVQKLVRDESTGGFSESAESFDDPLEYMETLMGGLTAPNFAGLPRFFGGAVGYLAYDSVRYFERVPISGEDVLGLPEFFFMLTDGLVIFDRLTHSMKIVAMAKVGEDRHAAYDEAIARIDGMIDALRRPLSVEPADVIEGGAFEVSSNMDAGRFMGMVARAKEYIAAGDIFQTVLSQRFRVPLKVDPLDVYRVLRRVNPSPYMYYLRHRDMNIIGSSPEPLVRVEDGTVLTRPIAGTRRRGRDEADDLRMEEDLLSDRKERAEHIMLVDLGRNDVGRVCVPGSVKVDEFMVIERYSHVMHIVSSVIGRLSPEYSAFDVLRAVFPAGTVSGAPKIRAMEIIDELEDQRRGPYAGAVGYFGYGGSLDTCITIRTIVVKDGYAYVQAGAGVVADSVPELELMETENKARALLSSVELAHAGQV